MTVKSVYREDGLKKLRQVSKSQDKQQREQLIYQQLFASSVWRDSQVIAIVCSLPHELATGPIIEQAWQSGKVSCLPKTFPKGQMDFYHYRSETDLAKTSFGVFEPVSEELVLAEQIDLMIVPGVVFREDGYRIGYGGGFYDRYISRYHGHSLSLVFHEQINNAWQPDQYDQAVEQLIIG